MFLPLPLFVELLVLVFGGYALLVFLTLLYFARIHKFKIAGPLFVPPLLGNLPAMIKDPYNFWDRQLQYNPCGYSWQSIMNKFVIFATKADLCQKIFATNGEDSLKLVLHPNGRIILGENNIAFRTGPLHRALRGSFINLFTAKSLALYLPIQERILKRHLKEWIENIPTGSKPQEMRTLIREMNCETSQIVFLGAHLRDRVKFTADYNKMTHGFLSAPIYFPGTALYAAVHARHEAMKQLEEAVQRSKDAMSFTDAQPVCLLDFWTRHVQEECKTAKEADQEVPWYSNNHDMADTMMDFLFASQDASTASLTFLVATLGDHREILDRVRKEVDSVHPNDEPLTFELLQDMQFTRQCVLEQLRLHPPAPMVPMLAHGDFVVDENFTLPKGSVIIPSLVGCCREGFTNPDTYDPDRMGSERSEDRKFSKQFIPFGAGPHRCVGYNYAINHLAVFLTVIAQNSSWVRTRTASSDKIMYLPTLYPHDCLCTWSRREI